VDFVGDKPGDSGWTPKYRGSRKEVKRHMKHVTIVSKPAKAEQTAWVDLKNVFGFDLGFVDLSSPLSGDQARWILNEVNNALTK